MTTENNTIDGEAREIPEGEHQANDLSEVLQQIDGGAPAGEQPAAADPAQAVPTCTPEEAIRGVLEAMLIPAQMAGMSRTTSLWTPEVLDKVSVAMVAVLKKYTWGQRIMQFLMDGLYIEEMMLATMLAPLVRATMDAVKADVADIRKAREEAGKAPA